MISKGDLERLRNEIATRDQGPEDKMAWLAKNEIEPFGFSELVQEGVVAFVETLMAGHSAEQAVYGCYAHAFQLGWESHEQYGRARQYEEAA